MDSSESATVAVVNDSRTELKNLRARILSGSFILLTGSGLVSGLNFAYNIAVARFLVPRVSDMPASSTRC